MKLEFKGINKYFGDFHVLKDVSFTVNSGEVFGYLGRNGAGKTTSIRILMDVFRANSGEILIDGTPFNLENYKIGYLPEERGMYSKAKIKDQLVYFAMLRGASKHDAEASAMKWAHRFEIDQYLDRKLETLSKGNQQKVQITQAFLNEPDILILDEPFSGLDPVNSKVFQDALVEYVSENRFVIFSSHQMSYVETFCDRIAIINFGEIVLEGDLKSIKRDLGLNKVFVSANNYSLQELSESFTAKGYDVSLDGKHIVVALLDNQTKTDLIQTLINEGVDIHTVGDYEPTLQDIFVNEVGR
ncbi:ABC transporter ATP-binding protein [Erysipelothrix larvae]|uniref:ABC transporter ATP-binding protein n=1 Tax=Erysipelothrix larvae TaxID=1514105 RepID=A0A0X8GY95_9FIRM|nr:ATP-binding cassette domain-containing protein [Erysipelothrix larvae]AMC92650.1 ABC transporter ATP-binding protein [Erysipelothrix larvae]